ncbi:MAG TPA: hypothetical protein VN306_08940 [Mycobacterium sp.]|nr:hypothetical protein [Mycobacterium sp.]
MSGRPARLVVVVGVAVNRNYGTVVEWCSADGQVWSVVCPQRSAVRCGVLPADA